MGDYWWIGQFNVILLTGFIAGRVCNQNRKDYWFNSLPEGYYRYDFLIPYKIPKFYCEFFKKNQYRGNGPRLQN